MKTNIVIDISPSITMSGKITALDLWIKILSLNQIAGFFKM